MFRLRGAIEMGGGSSQPISQTTVSTPSPQAQQLIGSAMPFLQQFAANPPQLPGFPMTAGFTPAQTAGQNMALGAAGQQGNIVGGAGGLENWMTGGGALSPSSNPALQSWINAAVQPIQQTYSEQIDPAIRQAAVSSGQYGGSEQGIAEGLAGRGEEQAIGATTANIANTGYLSGLNATMQALGLAPATAGAQTLPAQTTSAVGDVQQAQNQAQINEQIMRTMFPQMMPLQVGQELLSAGASIPGGTATTTGSMPTTSLGQMLMGGGAIAGGLLGNQGLGGLMSGAGNMFGSIGSGLSGLLGGGAAGAAGGTSMAGDLLPLLAFA
jgi:hypothetical protein